MSERNPRLRVDAIADGAWRLCDGGVDENDARCLLGYLEKVENGYELMWMVPLPGRCQVFRSYGEAIGAVSRSLSRDAAATPLSV